MLKTNGNMKKLPVLLAGFACLQSLPFCAEAARQPNIILIYVDDMGVGDAGYLGGEVEATPNIDRLAAEGKVFTRYYTPAPVCSPSRVGVTTGMYHLRWNILTFLHTREFNRACGQADYLVPSAPTVAKALREAGYRTAHIGKWHMGGGRDVDDAPMITEYGFDEYVSTYESPDPDPALTSTDWIWAPTDKVRRWNRTAYFVNHALAFLDRNKDRPCYINLWPDDVHTPWVPDETAEENLREYGSRLQGLRPVLGNFDRQIGRLMDGIRERGIDRETLVIFTSDNGPAPSFERMRTNELRGIKNSLYEGGVNMPFIAWWPGTIDAGERDDTSVIASIDLFPTFCAIAGTEPPPGFQLDGMDISQVLLGSESVEGNRHLFFEYGRNEHFKYPRDPDRSPQLAVRYGEWKLLTNPDGSVVELYNLACDPKEAKNLAVQHSEMAAELKERLISWYAALGH